MMQILRNGLVTMLVAIIIAQPYGRAELQADRTPITSQNAHLMEQIEMVGNGSYYELTPLPEPDTFAIAGSSGIWLYDASNASSSLRLITNKAATSLDSNGNLLIFGGREGILNLWDVETENQVRQLKINMPIDVVRFGLDGTIVAVASHDNVSLWNLETGNLVSTDQEMRFPFAFSPSGDIIAFSDGDFNLHLWNLKTEAELISFGHPDLITNVAFDASGGKIATTTSDGTMRIWNIDEPAEPKVLNPNNIGPINAIKFDPSGTLIASASDRGGITVRTVEEGTSFLTLESNFIADISFTPDSHRLVAIDLVGDIWVWDIENGLLSSSQKNPVGYADQILLNSDTTTIASFSSDNRALRLWDLSNNNSVLTLPDNIDSPFSIALDPTRGLVAYTGSIFTTKASVLPIKLFSLNGGTALPSIMEQWSEVNELAFNSDGSILAAVGRVYGNGKLLLWSTSTGSQLFTIETAGDPINSVDFDSSDNFLVVGTSKGKIIAWRVETGDKQFDLQGHNYGVEDVLFSPTGEIIASAGADQTVRLWNANTKTEMFTLQGHTDIVCCIAFSPDGAILASGGWDNSIRLWDVKTGENLVTLENHADRIEDISFSNDGGLLISSSRDRTIRLWGIP